MSESVCLSLATTIQKNIEMARGGFLETWKPPLNQLLICLAMKQNCKVFPVDASLADMKGLQIGTGPLGKENNDFVAINLNTCSQMKIE